jgi:DNA polymerase-3 subunit beta
VSILANEKLKGISIELTNNCISINSHNTENEEAEEKLDFEYSGSFVSLAFNGQYFLEAISNIDGEFAVLNFATEIGCCVISESTNNLYKFIVMSMTL